MAWAMKTDETTDNIWLEFDKLNKKGDSSDKLVRILEQEPETVWQHWAGRRSYNCAGSKENCPVCTAKEALEKLKGKDVAKDTYPTRSRSYFNVLDLENGEVKVLGFGYGLGKDLYEFQREYGDLRTYDLMIRKHKTGPMDMNIEYKLYKKSTRDLNEAEKTASAPENRHDIKPFLSPANFADLTVVANGAVPDQQEETPKNESTSDNPVEGTQASTELFSEIVTLAEQQGMNKDNLGVTDKTDPKLLGQLLEALKSGK